MKLNVFLTIDTEVSAWSPDWRESDLSQDLRRDIYGITSVGEYGINYQMDVLDKYNLRATFFVESYFACAIGLKPLREIVKLIQDRGHEVQLHIHTEWLEKMSEPMLGGKTGYNLKDFSEEEQVLLIERGVRNLRECDAENPCAFRAGNYGANWETLSALARNGILYDTSHNTCYLDSDCGMQTEEMFLQPRKVRGVYEFPVSFFSDRPNHYRHAQLCACSSQELQHALIQASECRWYSFVIVLHSFELINRKSVSPDRVVIRRFHRLCHFLAQNQDKFCTATFSEVEPDTIPASCASRPLHSHVLRTAWRYTEQLFRRLTP